jgi:SAM-dependent methyltransferase
MINNWTDHDVEMHWDKVASVYIRENERVKGTHDQRFREGVKLLAIKKGDRILNITSRDCGAEDYIKNEEPDCEVINAEISTGLIDVARSIRPGLNQVKIDTYSRLPFDNITFNRVLSLETLEHVAEPRRFLEELYRVSTENAVMVMSCPPATSEFPYRIYTALFGGHGEGPHRFPSSCEVKYLLKQSGWKLKLHYGTLLIPVGPEWIKKLGESIIDRAQGTFISELGIRQFYCCEKT